MCIRQNMFKEKHEEISLCQYNVGIEVKVEARTYAHNKEHTKCKKKPFYCCTQYEELKNYDDHSTVDADD